MVEYTVTALALIKLLAEPVGVTFSFGCLCGGVSEGWVVAFMKMVLVVIKVSHVILA